MKYGAALRRLGVVALLLIVSQTVSCRVGAAVVTNFVALDVRTSTEYGQEHIVDAINLDFYSADFQNELNALDKGKAYLVYCGSGGPNAQAMAMMESMGSVEVYNILGGMGAFKEVPGSEAYLVP